MKQEIRDLIDSKGHDDDWSTREVVLLETEAAVLLSRGEPVSLDDANKLIHAISSANWNRGWIKGNGHVCG